VMGGLHAREAGHPEAVWKAIYYQYLPIGVEADAPPTRADLGDAAPSWVAVTLADKLDTLASLFAAGERPTGTRDPFGLRRQAQGIVKVLIDLPEVAGLDAAPSLDDLASRAATEGKEAAMAPLSAFMTDRVRFVLTQRGLPIETVRAVTHRSGIRPLRARRVAQALEASRASADFQALAVLFKRVKNIAKELDAQGLGPGASGMGTEAGSRLDRTVLTEPAERLLLEEIDRRRPAIEGAVGAGDYRRAFNEIAALTPAVDRFFTDVFVMVDDARLRTARLALLAGLRDLVLDLADISEVVPQES
jgi:glycyl-tRNA synthetase beta chain